MNHFDASPSYMNGKIAMPEARDRKELERRLEQARRIAKSQPDLLTRNRIEKLIRDLEHQLK